VTVGVAAMLCALILATGIDYAVLDHRLKHVAVRFPDAGPGQTWLLIGSDERDRPGVRFAGQRADVILLVHLGAPRSSLISVPRDILLKDAQGGVERAALTFDGGPQQLIDGLCRTLGVAPTHLAIVTMHGFADIVDELGGLTVRIREPVRDHKARLEIDHAGQVHLDGAAALALVRSRHPLLLVDGGWTRLGERAGARARSRNAAAMFTALRRKARAARAHPLTLQRTLWATTGALTLDEGAGLSDVLDLLNSQGRLTVLPAAPLPRTIATLADGRTRQALRAAGYPESCSPRS
jgi:LCP family protein required for cell wall assembly